jgi:hypothetical protein
MTYLTNGFEFISELLAVKRFRPSPKLKERASEVLRLYFAAILREYGLSIADNVYGSTTDAGPDVKRMASILLEKVKITRTHIIHLHICLLLLFFAMHLRQFVVLLLALLCA